MYILQGNKPYLTGLLSMYKIHRPNLVTMATSASNKVSVGGFLQSNQVKRTPQDCIKELIIWNLKPLVFSRMQ